MFPSAAAAISQRIYRKFSEIIRILLISMMKKSETFLLNENGYINASGILRNTVSKTLELNRDYGGLTDITIGRLTDLWNITGDNPSVPPENDIATALSSVGTENIILNGNDITLKNNAALDFGAVGKGAALDACLSYLNENDCKKTYISTGSSVLFTETAALT